METIYLACVGAQGQPLSMDSDEYPVGTWAVLKAMAHPELDGLPIHEDAVRWDFYWMDEGELLSCNANGPIEAR